MSKDNWWQLLQVFTLKDDLCLITHGPRQQYLHNEGKCCMIIFVYENICKSSYHLSYHTDPQNILHKMRNPMTSLKVHHFKTSSYVILCVTWHGLTVKLAAWKRVFIIKRNLWWVKSMVEPQPMVMIWPNGRGFIQSGFKSTKHLRIRKWLVFLWSINRGHTTIKKQAF